MVKVVDYVRLSEDVYNKKSKIISGSWKRGEEKENKTSGFYAAIYESSDTGESVVVFRGTEVSDWNDIVADMQIVKNKLHRQFADAMSFLRQNSDAKTVLGHSLGGALAKYTAAKKGLTAYAFNAPGIKGIGGLANAHANAKIFNINAQFDVVSKVGDAFGSTKQYHVGSIPLVPDVLEPVVVGAVTVNTAGLAGNLAVPYYLLGQHSISNLAEKLVDEFGNNGWRYNPPRKTVYVEWDDMEDWGEDGGYS
ncbi:MAG: DUF2974 domain-containing protein [Gammaproteobacteria bacterium]|nr:DUF2974 domain-containing protein [Gammaproteobacteria bacterium]